MLILLGNYVSFSIALIMGFNLCILSQWFPGDEHPERSKRSSSAAGFRKRNQSQDMNDKKDCWCTESVTVYTILSGVFLSE